MGRQLSVVLPAVAVLVAFSGLFMAPVSAEALGSWNPTTNYPYGIQKESCVVSSGYIVCIGGSIGIGRLPTNGVYYASVSPSGVGVWVSTTSYPINIDGQSCVISSGYVYCVGGRYLPNAPFSTITNAVYYAPVSQLGVGTWTSTTSYPTLIAGQSCVVSSTYVYCIGGFAPNPNGIGGGTGGAYYAPLSPLGVGAWTSTTSYATNTGTQACVVSSSYIYCVDGTNAVYYASISAFGVESWTSTTSYPSSAGGQPCVVWAGYVYCIGGPTYYAPLSPSGVGTWTSTTSYPTNAAGKPCVVSSGYVYCVGGNIGGGPIPPPTTNAVYYAAISSPPTPCQESDGNGDFQGQQNGNFNFDNDGCKDGDRDQVSSTNRGDGRDFQSTEITSTTFDAASNTITITGVGMCDGVPVTFVFVAVETGPTTPGWVSFAFSDGYANAGPLVSGIILLH